MFRYATATCCSLAMNLWDCTTHDRYFADRANITRCHCHHTMVNATAATNAISHQIRTRGHDMVGDQAFFLDETIIPMATGGRGELLAPVFEKGSARGTQRGVAQNPQDERQATRS